MKFFRVLFSLIFILVILSVSAFAKDDIKLYIDGKLIKTDVSPAIVNNRTMVPVRSVFEELGADVTWIGSRKQVIIRTLSTRIVLNVGKSKAYVNDKSFELDVSPDVIDNRTMIPVRFVSETLGYDVEWSSKTNSVHINTPKKADDDSIIQKINVNTGTKSSTVYISVDNMKKPTISYATNPMRFIADFEDTEIYGGDSRLVMNTDDITEVRYAQHQDFARVVIETPNDAQFSVKYTSGSMIVTVKTERVDKEEPKDDKPQNEIKDNDSTDESKEETPKPSKPVRPVPRVDKDNPIIVLDAGHGGWDGGAIGVDEDGDIIVKESDANLAITKSVQKYLEAEDITVIMTRSTDVSLGTTEMEDLVSRSDIANVVGATFFVSIHNNSFVNEAASGTEILYISGGVENEFGVSGEDLAQNILTPLIQATGLTNRGLKHSPNIVVLKETSMPAVLVECAFISNPDDRKLLVDFKKIDDMGYAIALGIMETISEFE